MSTYLGIDVGSKAVKVVALRSTYRKTAIVGVASVDIDAPVPQAEVPAAPPMDPIAHAVRTAVATALGGKIASDGIAVALDGARAAVRTLELPQSAQKQLADVLAFELEAQVPLEMSESVFDYRVLPPPRGAKGDEPISIVVAVARIDDVRARINLVKQALGQEPDRVGVGAFPLGAVAQHVPMLGEGGPVVVLLDLGNKGSEVLILRDGEAAFARTLSQGTEGLPASASKLAREIRLSIGAYRAQGGPAPTRVILCGGGAFVSGAEGFLSGELEMPVDVLPPAALDLTALSPERVSELPRYAKALGLALSLTGRGAGLNLRKGPLAYERGYGFLRDKIPLVAGLAAVIFVSFVFSAWAKMHAATHDRETLEKALATVTKEVLGEETTSASRAQELLDKQIGAADEDPLPHADAFDVMVKISEAIPQSMKHDIEELDVQKGHVIVHGVVGSAQDAQSIATSLKSERCFQDVKVSRMAAKPGAADRQKYVMEFDLKCPEDVKGARRPGAAASAAPSASGSGGK